MESIIDDIQTLISNLDEIQNESLDMIDQIERNNTKDKYIIAAIKVIIEFYL